MIPPAATMPRRFLREPKKPVSLALGNFGALGVMDALCAVMSARVRGSEPMANAPEYGDRGRDDFGKRESP